MDKVKLMKIQVQQKNDMLFDSLTIALNCLEYYADLNEYIGQCDETGRTVKTGTVSLDRGSRARICLTEIRIKLEKIN